MSSTGAASGGPHTTGAIDRPQSLDCKSTRSIASIAQHVIWY